MGELLGVDRSQALALASIEALLRVTQVVNGVKGVHAILPHETIARLREPNPILTRLLSVIPKGPLAAATFRRPLTRSAGLVARG